MSKKEISTKDKIIDKAIELFNEQGIEYVGVRELAKALNMKGGNITYYFPTKDDIIMEVANRLTEDNNKVIVKKENITPEEFLRIFRQAYKNHFKYRSLFLSFPNIIRQNEGLRKKYRERQLLRRQTIAAQLEELVKAGYLKGLAAPELDTLLNSIVLVSRFWISNASIDGRLDNRAIDNNLQLIAGLLLLVATPKGKKHIDAFTEIKKVE